MIRDLDPATVDRLTEHDDDRDEDNPMTNTTSTARTEAAETALYDSDRSDLPNYGDDVIRLQELAVARARVHALLAIADGLQAIAEQLDTRDSLGVRR